MAKCNLGEVKLETNYAVSIANHVWAGLRAFSGSKCFYVQYSFGGQVILHALSLLMLALKPFLLPAFPFLWVGLDKYLKTFHCGSR